LARQLNRRKIKRKKISARLPATGRQPTPRTLQHIVYATYFANAPNATKTTWQNKPIRNNATLQKPLVTFRPAEVGTHDDARLNFGGPQLNATARYAPDSQENDAAPQTDSRVISCLITSKAVHESAALRKTCDKVRRSL
jgi:hypothetical protein